MPKLPYIDLVSATTLARAETGVPAVVREVGGPPALVRRLAELGIRRSAVLVPGHRTAGGGRVVEVAGCRIALAAAVLETISTDGAP